MDEPSLDDLRKAKDELAQRLKVLGDFAGIGIGRQGGRLVIKVNWRKLPPERERLRRIGNIEVIHQEVGTIRAQPYDDTS